MIQLLLFVLLLLLVIEEYRVSAVILRGNFISNLPSPNIRLNTPEGRILFGKLVSIESPMTHVAVETTRYLETQVNLGGKLNSSLFLNSQVFNEVMHKTNIACAPASAVTILNALQYKPPIDPAYTPMGGGSPFPHWTQSSYIFEPCVKQVVGPHVYGETLESFSKIMRCLGLNVDIQYVALENNNVIQEKIKSHLIKGHFVVANFDRQMLHEEGGGHFSPIAGFIDNYFLIMDVARYKYPPIFGIMDDVVKSMSVIDIQSGKSRGYVAVWINDDKSEIIV